MLMKLASLSLVKGTMIEKENWLMATKKRSMPITQHGMGREQRAKCEENSEGQSKSKRLKVKKLLNLGTRGLLKVTREEWR